MELIGFHCSLHIGKSKPVNFDSFGIENVPQEIINKIKVTWITHNIFRMQSVDSVLCVLYCIASIEYMIAGNLSEYTNLFSPIDYKKNDKIIYNNFKDKYDRRKHQSRL